MSKHVTVYTNFYTCTLSNTYMYPVKVTDLCHKLHTNIIENYYQIHTFYLYKTK